MKANCNMWTRKQPASAAIAGGPVPLTFPTIGMAAGIPGVDRNTLLQTILSDASVGIVVCNSHGRITLANRTAKELAQMEPEGRPLRTAPSIWGDLFDGEGRRVPVAEWPSLKALHGQITIGRECRLVRHDGQWHDILFSASPLRDAGSQTLGALTSFANITEQKQKELVLREHAVLNERSRIAADIHDTVVQGLNAVLLQLEAAEQEIFENPTQALQRLRRTCEVARQSLAEARRSVWTLGPETFENEDLSLAVAFLAQKICAGTSIKLQLSLHKEACRLTPEMRLGLLRIAKEALVNVLKHAHATKVRIELTYTGQRVRLSVLDNGRGFLTYPVSTTQTGFGLFGLHTRAQCFGGHVVVHSRPGHGTRITTTALVPGNLAQSA